MIFCEAFLLLLRPFGSLVFQTAKFIIVVGQWTAAVLRDNPRQVNSFGEWMQMLGQSLGLAALR